MELLLALVVLLVIAAAAFVYMRGRPGGVGGLRGGSQAPSLRGTRGAQRAERHDPMAVAVERHAQAVDPGEAAREEQNLQAQARSVAADLHARQAGQPDPHQAQVEAGFARTDADPYAEREPYLDPRVVRDGGDHPGSDAFGRPADPSAAQVDANRAYAQPDPYADPVESDARVYADPYAQPVDGRVYPAQAPDPYAQPVSADYPAQPPAANGRPFDPDYPAQVDDPYARPADADYPAQAPDPYAQPVDPDYPAQAPDAAPPRKGRRFF